LLLIIGSFDILASLNGGNVELLLLFAALLASWLLWRHHNVLAAPLISFVLLVKPFYLLLFIAKGLLQLLRTAMAQRAEGTVGHGDVSQEIALLSNCLLLVVQAPVA
jgi:hypothetical protein